MRILFSPDGDMGAMPGDDEQLPPDSSNSGSQSFYLPDSFPGRENYKPGDTIELKVVGQDKDGDLEVECVHPKSGEGKSMSEDLRASVPETPGPGY